MSPKSSMYYLFIFLLILLTFMLIREAEAKVTGDCSHCHTMHNSQGGQAMARDDSGTPTSTPYGSLLIYSCAGCHSSTTASVWKDSVTGTPIVYNTTAPTFNSVNGLAGGNFYYSSTTVDNTGHNVFTANPDGTLGNTPPGGTALAQQIRCAGTYGCHGHNGRQTGDTSVEDQIAAMKGGHHGNDSPPLTGSLTDVAKNYRFLLGIKGKEDVDWEKDYMNTSHNEYQGSTAFTDSTTINYFCGECHGNYHSSAGVGTASPWLRHPTDIALKSSGEYASYTAYSMVAPVARPNPDSVANTTVVTPGTDIIMCFSCHRSHASPYYKMLRWDYKSSTLSSALSGCNVCHTSKN